MLVPAPILFQIGIAVDTFKLDMNSGVWINSKKYRLFPGDNTDRSVRMKTDASDRRFSRQECVD